MNVFGDNVLSVYPYKHEKIVVCAHVGNNYNHCSDKKIGRVDIFSYSYQSSLPKL